MVSGALCRPRNEGLTATGPVSCSWPGYKLM
jgi:hypothetical protein